MSHASRKFLGRSMGAVVGDRDEIDGFREELWAGEERGVIEVIPLPLAVGTVWDIVWKHSTDGAFPEGGGDRRPVVYRSAGLVTLKLMRYCSPGPFLSCPVWGDRDLGWQRRFFR